MKLIKRILLMVLCAMPSLAGAQVATTAGSNLTAWNGDTGSINNNNWNSMMNSRVTSAGANSGPAADYGNCNSLILRCAQPKCSGCSSMDLARPIVRGCVNSNASCKKYGEDLVEYISAQLVSSASAKAQQQQLAAQQAAAASNNQQMQQMQAQMQQMQYEMQQQNAAQMQQMQAALDEQKQMVAAAQAEAAAAQQRANAVSDTGLTALQQNAIDIGVSNDVMLREQISGEILSKVENAEAALKKLKVSMDNTFNYAGCDARGDDCAGPNRVKTFKDKALGFITPYEEIVDEMYEALETALAVGVDVSDVIMMLSGSCNKWGKYICRYGETSSTTNTNKIGTYDEACEDGKSKKNLAKNVRGIGAECSANMQIPPQDDMRCQLVSLYDDTEDTNGEEFWALWSEENSADGDETVRIGCATSMLDSISIFGRRSSRRGAALDLDTLERMIIQDAPDNMGKKDKAYKVQYCGLTYDGLRNLDSAIEKRTLPSTKLCVRYDSLLKKAATGDFIVATDGGSRLSSRIAEGTDNNMCEQFEELCDDGCSKDDTDKCVKFDNNRCEVLLPNLCRYDMDTGRIRKMEEEEACKALQYTWKNSECECKKDGNAGTFKLDKENKPTKYECASAAQVRNLSNNNNLFASGGRCQDECLSTGGRPDGLSGAEYGNCCKCGQYGKYNPAMQKCVNGRIERLTIG